MLLEHIASDIMLTRSLNLTYDFFIQMCYFNLDIKEDFPLIKCPFLAEDFQLSIHFDQGSVFKILSFILTLAVVKLLGDWTSE